MRITRDGQRFIATRTTGPTHNLLTLDFDQARQPYAKDHSGPTAASAERLRSIRVQVARALDEAGIAETAVTGIEYLSDDSASDTVYFELAKAIIAEHRNHAE